MPPGVHTDQVLPESSPWPQATVWSQRVFEARNANEAQLFVQCQGGTTIDSRAVGPQIHFLARHPDGDKVHRFTLARGAPFEPTDFGAGVSDILDPAELLFFADRVVRELPGPDDRMHPRAVIRRLRLAAAALREAVKLVERGDVAYFTNAARNYAAEHPDRLAVAALQNFAAALDGHADEWERR